MRHNINRSKAWNIKRWVACGISIEAIALYLGWSEARVWGKVRS